MIINTPGTYKLCYRAFEKMLTVTGWEVPVTDVSDIANVIYMDPQVAYAGGQSTLQFKMKNNVPIRSFQFDFYLPEGMTVAKNANSGKIQASLVYDRLPEDDSHTLTVSEQEDGAIRFLCGSEYNENFAVGDGLVLTLKVNVSENMQAKEYPVILRTMTLSETNINNHYDIDILQSKVTVNPFLLGDVNGDGVVNVLDYTSVANYIHGNIAEGFIFKAGDIDGNQVINVIDYTGVANIIHTGSPTGESTAGAGAKAVVVPFDEADELDPQ